MQLPGLPTCGGELTGCAPFGGPLESSQVGEMTVELPRALMSNPQSLGLLGSGDRFDAVYLEDCGGAVGCGEAHQHQVTVFERYRVERSDVTIANEGDYLTVAAEQIGDTAVVATYASGDPGELSLFVDIGDGFNEPYQIPRTVLPMLSVAMAPPPGDTDLAPVMYWAQESIDEVSLHVDGVRRDVDQNRRGLVTMPPLLLDAAGTAVVYQGELDGAPRHVYWAAPPQDLPDAAPCFASDGCDPVFVGGSTPGGMLTPNGRPSVVVAPGGAPIGVFPVLRDGVMPELIYQTLVPGCGPSGSPEGECPRPRGLDRTGGARLHETATAGAYLFVVFGRDGMGGGRALALNIYRLDALRAAGSGAVSPILELPLMTDRPELAEVRALRTKAEVADMNVQVGTLIRAADDQLLLNVVRLCDIPL